jgi:hypothetical protein
MLTTTGPLGGPRLPDYPIYGWREAGEDARRILAHSARRAAHRDAERRARQRQGPRILDRRGLAL